MTDLIFLKIILAFPYTLMRVYFNFLRKILRKYTYFHGKKSTKRKLKRLINFSLFELLAISLITNLPNFYASLIFLTKMKNTNFPSLVPAKTFKAVIGSDLCKFTTELGMKFQLAILTSYTAFIEKSFLFDDKLLKNFRRK